MTRQPRLLDLFCGAGGSAMGYHRAGFEVVGVDIAPQPHFPFEFHQADALTYPLDGFDVVHASPPCQGYSRTRHLPWLKGRIHPMLIPDMLARFLPLGIPWVIENVGDAPLDGIRLRGGMFGLHDRRLRVFQSNVLLLAPTGYREPVGKSGGLFGNRLDQQQKGLGCDWMTRAEASEAIPPAYTEFIGRQLLRYVLEAAP
jgi:DNA (cytosine-5)-methyltransferase 1